eukprot:Hpha_TRINITY_DN16408_c4_g1::TRINITY_DN16408_c4_g1_i1::g.159377::m.159377
MSAMERKQSSQAMQSGSRASVTGSSVTNRSHMGRHRQANQRKQGDKGDQPQMRVLDPDHRDVDRTPKSLLREVPASRTGTKKKKEGVEAGTSQSGEEPSVSVSRMESSDSGSESSRMESSAESDGEESVAGMDRLALDDETSSMDSRVQPDEKKKKDGKGGKSTSEESGEEGLLSKMGGRETPQQDKKDKKGDKEAKEKREMTYDERLQWRKALETVTLTETETLFLLDRPDEQVLAGEAAEHSEEVAQRKARYERYVDMCLKAKNSDKYMERGMITFNEPHKNKETQFQPPPTGRASVNATVWEIADTMRALEEEEAADEPALGAAGGEAAAEGGGEAAEEAEMDDETTMLMAEMDDDGGDDTGRHDRHARRRAWMNADKVLTTLLQVERVVVHNIWQAEQLAYRGLRLENHLDATEERKQPPAGSPGLTRGSPQAASMKDIAGARRDGDDGGDDDDDEEEARGEANMRVLWKFGCSVTQNKNITCMSWNRSNSDLLAVGYGEYGIPGAGNNAKRHDGLVACWSLKNPVHPERIIEVANAGVSAVGFSHDHPNLLAVGNTDGTLALYDVRKRGNLPALKSTVSSIPGAGQHTGTIWEVQWVQKGRDRGESLVSIAADGRVKQWSIKKGLECVNLLRLKRSQGEAATGTAAAKGGEAMLSRQSGGMCFDFNPSEPIQYIVGTEDGTVHKCNTTNQEQYIPPDFQGHGGEPVYRTRYSPFCNEYFLTCSADWTTRLWSEKKSNCVLTFDSVQAAVHDCAWSPVNSCVFGTVTAQGRVDVYNLKGSLEPACKLPLDDRRLNCMQFAQQESAVLVVGDDKGEVTVIKLDGEEYERPSEDDVSQSDQFQKTVQKLTA